MNDNSVSEVRGLVYVAVAVAAIGGLLFGYDTGVISGAILFIKHQFSLSAVVEEIVVSSLLAGAVVGAVIGGAFTDRFGRRTMIMLASLIFAVSAACTALAPRVTCLIAARVVSGIGIGIGIGILYLSDVHRRIGAGKSPRRTSGGQHAGNYDRYSGRLHVGLCMCRQPGLAVHVWLGGNTSHHARRWDVVATR